MPTPNTGIPYVPEGTLDPAAGLNLALNHIDGLLQAAVLGTEDAPPGSPADGDQYIVGAGSGDWVGQDDNVARYVAEGTYWQFYEAGAEVREVLDLSDFTNKAYTGSGGWIVVGGLSDAPSDGTGYVRKDGAWVAESGSGSARDTVTVLSIASGVVNIDCALGDFFTLSLTANVTSITFSNLPAAGKGASLAVRIRQDATGSRTVALPASFKATGGSDTAVQAAANAYTLLTITTFDQGTRWEYAMQEIAA